MVATNTTRAELVEERLRVWQPVPKLRVLRMTDVLYHSACVKAESGAVEQNETLKTRLPSQQIESVRFYELVQQ